ncbi:MAG: hypothetical protein H0V76_05005 [Blastocatellia bacterium]|nr:hypothetical protein [Blastocatellia bacterium]
MSLRSNLREDVLLVQFASIVIASTPTPTSSPEFNAAVAAVRLTGTVDPATINAISATQREVQKKGAGGPLMAVSVRQKPDTVTEVPSGPSCI